MKAPALLWLCISAFPLQAAEIGTNLVMKPGAMSTANFDARETAAAESALLSLKARLQSPRIGGSTYALKLTLNGTPLEPEHIINKPRVLTTREGRTLGWFANTGWRVPYAPDFDANAKSTSSAAIVDPDPHNWIFDVTRLLKPGSNALVIAAGGSVPLTSPLVVENLQLTFKPTEFVRRVKWEEEEEPTWSGPALFVPSTVRHPDIAADQPNDRTLRVTAGTLSFVVHSDYRCADPRAFRVNRNIRVLDECVEVSDEIENLTDHVIGIMINHRVPIAGEVNSVYLCGWPKPAREGTQHQAAHPSVFVAGEAGAIALLARDDVFRLHCRSEAKSGSAGLSDSQFGLGPGKRHTSRWTVFPVPSGDYWDFVNAARRAIDVNFTLDGPFGFVSTPRRNGPMPTDDDLRAFAQNRSLRLASASIPYSDSSHRYLHGSGYLEADGWAARSRDILQRLKRLRPGLRVVTYFHEFISTETGATEKYPDSRIIRSDGSQANYPYRYPLPMFCPTESNSYGRALPGFFGWAFGEVGAEGIYWDEMDASSETYTFGGEWDGHTVEMDSRTLAVSRKMAMVSLLSHDWRIRQAKSLLERGPLIANGQPQTDSMMRLHFPRFVETGDINHLINAQLYSPIGLGDHLTEKTEKDVARQIRAHLYRGCLYYFYSAAIPMTHPQLTDCMFPFTPIELHPGVLIGAERILTARSGIFGWGDDSRARLRVFDPEGHEQRPSAKGIQFKESITGKQRRHELKMPPKWVACLERLKPD